MPARFSPLLLGLSLLLGLVAADANGVKVPVPIMRTLDPQNGCAGDIEGTTRVEFPVVSNGGMLVGYRFDPESGPSTRVMVGYPGSAELADSLKEFGFAMAAAGISFISMAYPGSYDSYFSNGPGLPKYNTMEEVAMYYFEPITEKLRAEGTKQIIGFGAALGNRLVRLAETHVGLFDAVVVASAGDQFSGFVPGTELFELNKKYEDEALSTSVRYDAWRKIYLGTKYRNIVIYGGFARVTNVCYATISPYYPEAISTPYIYPREEWTTIQGFGKTPLLIIAGSEDVIAPLATNGEMYKAYSPDSVTLKVIEGGGHMLNWEAPALIAKETKTWLDDTLSPCERRIVGATKVEFHVPSNGGTLVGYRMDPESGPSTTVMVGYPGSAEPVDSLAEYAKEMAKQGISFIAMAYPGSYNSYFADKDGLPKYQTFEEVATYYFRPVTEKLRADGAKQIVGFGSALGNRIVRLAETHLGLFDVVVVVSAGDQFGGFVPGTEAFTNNAIWKNATNSIPVRYDAWKKIYVGTKYRDSFEIDGGFARATDVCYATISPYYPEAISTPYIYPREEWTTIQGFGKTPLLIIAGSEDVIAPLATNGEMYKSFSPDSVTLKVIEGGGHMLNYEVPDLMASTTKTWLDDTLSPCERRIVGATKVEFHVPSNGGTLVGYRMDPESGPSTTVMVGYPGSAEPVDSLAEYAKEMAKQGISFIAMAYPGSYNSYFADKDGLPKYQTFEEVATYYFRPVTEKLRADGAKQIVGFGSALGNRIVRLAETHLGLFDVVVVVSAGDQFGGFVPGTEAFTNNAIWKNATNSIPVRYDAWKKIYVGTKYRDSFEIDGGFARATDVCYATISPYYPEALSTPYIYPREEWTTIQGITPLLIIAGSEDVIAPLATNGEMYKAYSPDSVTLKVIEGGGHMLNWEAPALIAKETKTWLDDHLDSTSTWACTKIKKDFKKNECCAASMGKPLQYHYTPAWPINGKTEGQTKTRTTRISPSDPASSPTPMLYEGQTCRMIKRDYKASDCCKKDRKKK